MCTGTTSTFIKHVDAVPVHTGRFEFTHRGRFERTHRDVFDAYPSLPPLFQHTHTHLTSPNKHTVFTVHTHCLPFCLLLDMGSSILKLVELRILNTEVGEEFHVNSRFIVVCVFFFSNSELCCKRID